MLIHVGPLPRVSSEPLLRCGFPSGLALLVEAGDRLQRRVLRVLAALVFLPPQLALPIGIF